MAKGENDKYQNPNIKVRMGPDFISFQSIFINLSQITFEMSLSITPKGREV